MFRILAFTVKPRESADSRFRVLQFKDIAARAGIIIDHRSFMGSRYFHWQLKNRRLVLRLLLYPILFIVRLWQVLCLAPKYDCVWISREMAPLGPPILEHLLVWSCKRVIFDIDDALHISDRKMARLIPRLLRDRSKFGRMANRYSAIVCGSEHLAAFYSQYSSNVCVIPTVVDVAQYSTCERSQTPYVRIGWVGTPLNRDHLELVRPALQELAKERRFELVIVGLNEPLRWDLSCVRYMDWKLEQELSYFEQFDIGIMPLRDSPFARGKCAFKLVQYMAAGIPVVASPVGANCQIVEQGLNGYLADTQQEWYSSLKLLIDSLEDRTAKGHYARSCIRRYYSLESAWSRYESVLTGTLQPETVCAL